MLRHRKWKAASILMLMSKGKPAVMSVIFREET